MGVLVSQIMIFAIQNEGISEDFASRFDTLSSSFTRLKSVNTLFHARIKGRLLHWTDEVGRDAASFRINTEATQIHHLMITLKARMGRCNAEVVQKGEPNLAITNERRTERWDIRP